MSPSIVDKIYKMEKILGKWSYPGKAVFSYSRGFEIKIFPCRVDPNRGGASYVPFLDLSPSMLKSSRRPWWHLIKWNNRTVRKIMNFTIIIFLYESNRVHYFRKIFDQ